MHESSEDLAALQALLDHSYAAAGEHLRAIHAPARRMDAAQVARRLEGMCLLVLATTSTTGRPFTGPVDGVFHRGSFYFGTDPEALRWRHILRDPTVSATHLPSELFAVTVHGRAVRVDTGPEDPEGIRETLLDVYVPLYGSKWEQFLDSGPVYARIEAERMFALDVAAGSSEFSDMLEDGPDRGT